MPYYPPISETTLIMPSWPMYLDNTNYRSLYTDDDTVYFSTVTTTIRLVNGSTTPQVRTITSDWADADACYGGIVLGGYFYTLMADTTTTPDTWRVYRYDITNLAAGGTQMTFSGATVLTTTNFVMAMVCDGANFYFNYEAGNSANSWVVAKYSLSGTTLTYVSSATCGSAMAGFNEGFAANSNGDIFVTDDSTYKLRKYNSSGTLQWETSQGIVPNQAVKHVSINGLNYYMVATTGILYRAYSVA